MAATTGKGREYLAGERDTECSVCRYVFSAKGEVKKDVYEQFLDIVGWQRDESVECSVGMLILTDSLQSRPAVILKANHNHPRNN